ncbi:hypothetical protein AQUCO_00300840v1 [Aquilegia coerulea]|uniref:RING-type E3 ubiquitin transferase n=1 Tax=Aquilegia coerulea TaxID=218851 RepID=A0A2G5F126_AQUCA|nr:hypothetical protein AQUCO_00300840v1 [Aquilegia coerulea]
MSRVYSSSNRNFSYSIRDKSCPICLKHVNDRRAAVLSICLHVYCINCIHKWSQLKRNCPLCNANFNSWFYKSRFGYFKEEKLPKNVVEKKNKSIEIADYRAETRSFSYHSSVRRSFNEVRRQPVSQHCRELPWRRSFGQKHEEGIAQRVLQWRANVYDQGLRAVPLPSNSFQDQDIVRNQVVKTRMQQRIEPWITRELQAILHDSDPLVIVHLATSLFMSSLDEKFKDSPVCSAGEDMFVRQLRPFLHDRSDRFWHELRCFAGSSFEMATYDSVVEYECRE